MTGAEVKRDQVFRAKSDRRNAHLRPFIRAVFVNEKYGRVQTRACDHAGVVNTSSREWWMDASTLLSRYDLVT